MKIPVQDANVLINLELTGLFDLWFQTGIETHTTDLIRTKVRPFAKSHFRLNDGSAPTERTSFKSSSRSLRESRSLGGSAATFDPLVARTGIAFETGFVAKEHAGGRIY
jgi:hypothetical protein